MIRTSGTPIHIANTADNIHRYHARGVMVLALLLTGAVSSGTALPASVSAQSMATAKLSSKPSPGVSVLPLESNGEPLELASLGSMRITSNGGVLFADTKPVSVRIREGRAGDIRSVARQGAGPGEFRLAPDFVGYTADSIAAFDAGLRRWSVLSPNGVFVRVLATGKEADAYSNAAAWIADGALVFNASIEKDRAPLPAVLVGIVAELSVNSAPVVIRQVRNGDLWGAPTIDSKTWTVYDRAGRFRATYNLPSAFRFADANDSVAIGLAADEDDLPQIMRIQLRKATAGVRAKANNGSAAGVVDATDAERVEARAALTKLLVRMVGSQEAVYSDSNKYTKTVRALKMDVPSGMHLDIVDANNRGWFAVARDSRARVSCAMGVGLNLVIGWSEARPYCSQ